MICKLKKGKFIDSSAKLNLIDRFPGKTEERSMGKPISKEFCLF